MTDGRRRVREIVPVRQVTVVEGVHGARGQAALRVCRVFVAATCHDDAADADECDRQGGRAASSLLHVHLGLSYGGSSGVDVQLEHVFWAAWPSRCGLVRVDGPRSVESVASIVGKSVRF